MHIRIPPPPLKEPRQLWEHTATCVDDSKTTILSVLKQMSAEGWELVAVLAGRNAWDYTLFFKRPA
jgi:hypothetical protein